MEKLNPNCLWCVEPQIEPVEIRVDRLQAECLHQLRAEQDREGYVGASG